MRLKGLLEQSGSKSINPSLSQTIQIFNGNIRNKDIENKMIVLLFKIERLC
ncbi:hypothetical protein NUSPORA_02452 [Nucleospora cyclopteri]